MISKIIDRARLATNNVKDLALLDVYGRVARLLLNMAVERGRQARDPREDHAAGDRRARRRLARHGEPHLPRPHRRRLHHASRTASSRSTRSRRRAGSGCGIFGTSAPRIFPRGAAGAARSLRSWPRMRPSPDEAPRCSTISGITIRCPPTEEREWLAADPFTAASCAGSRSRGSWPSLGLIGAAACSPASRPTPPWRPTRRAERRRYFLRGRCQSGLRHLLLLGEREPARGNVLR